MITLDDDFSLSDVLKAINKHYSFSYTEIIKEARALNQQSVSIPVKEEYLIPDTHPDVYKILSLDVETSIINKEVQTDKVVVETLLKFNVIYLAKESDKISAVETGYLPYEDGYIVIKF